MEHKAIPDPSKYAELLDDIAKIDRYLLDEIFKGLGLKTSGLLQRLLAPAILPIIHRFAMAAQEFDLSVAQDGFRQTAEMWLKKWTSGIKLAGVEDLPLSGPLLVAANHPGTFDVLALASNVPRDDLKVVIGANPIFLTMQNSHNHFIFAYKDPHKRMSTFRDALRHLRNGGSLLIFSSGMMDPDPYYFADAARQALDRWSKSLELFLRKAPETRLFIAINSGFVAPEYLRHPITRLRRKDDARQKLAVFIQSMQLLIRGRRVSNQPSLAFAQPVLSPLLTDSWEDIQNRITEMARQLIDYSIGGITDFPAAPKDSPD
jgi:hypothetical protein